MNILLALISLWLSVGIAGAIYVIDKEISYGHWRLTEDTEPYGMILAGLLLGPFVFTIIWDDEFN